MKKINLPIKVNNSIEKSIITKDLGNNAAFNVLPKTLFLGEKKRVTTKDIMLLKTPSNMVSKKMSPPLIKTWLNGVYNFNSSLIKNLPSADNIVYKLIKSYFFMNPLWQNLDGKKSRLLVRRFRRASLNRISVSKPEIKHSNDKVFINLYIYNKRKNTYLYKLNHIYKNLKNSNLQTLLSIPAKKLGSLDQNVSKSSLAPYILSKFIDNLLSQKKSLNPLQNTAGDVNLAKTRQTTTNLPIQKTQTKSLTLHDKANSIQPSLEWANKNINNVNNEKTLDKGYNTLHSYILRTKKGVSHTLHVLSYGLKKSHSLKDKTSNFFKKKSVYSNLSVRLNGFVPYKPMNTSNKGKNSQVQKVQDLNLRNTRLHAFYKGSVNLKRFLLSEKNRRLVLSTSKIKEIYNNEISSFNVTNIENTLPTINLDNKKISTLVKSDNPKTTLRLNVYKNLELYNKYKYQIFKSLSPDLALKQTQHFMKSNIFNNLNIYKLASDYNIDNVDNSNLANNYVSENINQKYNLLGLGNNLNKQKVKTLKILNSRTSSNSLSNNLSNQNISNMPLKSLSTAFTELSMLGFKAKALSASNAKNLDVNNNVHSINLCKTYKLLNKSYSSKLNFIKSLMFKFNVVTNRPFYINEKNQKKATLFKTPLQSLGVNITPKDLRNLKGKKQLYLEANNSNNLNRLKDRLNFVKNLISSGVRTLPIKSNSRLVSYKGEMLNLNGLTLQNIKTPVNILAPLYESNTPNNKVDLLLQGKIDSNSLDAKTQPYLSSASNISFKAQASNSKNSNYLSKSLNQLSLSDRKQNRYNLINSYAYMSNAFNKLDRFFKIYVNSFEKTPLVAIDKNFNTAVFANNQDNIINKKINNITLTYKKKIISQILNLETSYIHYLTLLEFNNSLFKNWAINPLCNIISRIYNKKVVFNIVSLKAMYFNSDILSSLISLRLNNHKKNRYNKVFKKVLRAVALAKVNEHSYNSQSETYKSLTKHYQSYNNINNVLGLIPSTLKSNVLLQSTDMKNEVNEVKVNVSNHKGAVLKRLNPSLINTINFIKHKSVFGIRLEASGRLTKRSTASRKIFKFRYLGNLRLNDTINRKVPGVIVKDNITNNIQFSKISSKTRNGAFGIKGWINQA